jgi:hypothetical protein
MKLEVKTIKKIIELFGELKKHIDLPNQIPLLMFYVSLIAFGFFINKLYFDEQEKKIPVTYFDKTVEIAEKKYSKFKELTPEELHHNFLKQFYGFTYKLDGDVKWKKVDCSTGIWNVLKSYGYPGKMKNVRGFAKEFESLGIKKRKTAREVRHTDIIILNMKKRIPHMGMVWNITPKGVIQYMDINSISGTASFPETSITARKVYGIYPITKLFWLKELFEKIR